MTTLRATAIMKTDISGSTARFRALGEADLHALLTGEVQRQLADTPWAKRLQPLDVEKADAGLAKIEVYRLGEPEAD